MWRGSRIKRKDVLGTNGITECTAALCLLYSVMCLMHSHFNLSDIFPMLFRYLIYILKG